MQQLIKQKTIDHNIVDHAIQKEDKSINTNHPII